MKDFDNIISTFWNELDAGIDSNKLGADYSNFRVIKTSTYDLLIGDNEFYIRIDTRIVLSFNAELEFKNNITTYETFSQRKHTPFFKSHDEYFNYCIENECNLTWESISIIKKIINKIISLNIPFNVSTGT